MGDVSVIGTGAMGTALIRTLARADTSVTIWNRTRARADALAGAHVAVASTPAEALTASPLTIVSLSDHTVALALLEENEAALRDRIVASTSFAAPDQSEVLRRQVDRAGGAYLDLAIVAFPRDIGADHALIVVSGDRRSFEAHRAVFERFGTVSYGGEEPGAAFTNELIFVLPYLPMAVSTLQAARLCRIHGLPLDDFAETVRRYLPAAIDSLLERIVTEVDPSDPVDVEASVRVWRDGATEYRDHLRELGLDDEVYEALARMFSGAVDAGYGDRDWTCIADVTSTDEARPQTGRTAPSTQ